MRVVFYYPLEIPVNAVSGSSVRIKNIYDQFLKTYGESNVFVISGSFQEKNVALGNLKVLLKSGVEFSFAYSESANIPSVLSDKDHIPRAPLFELKLFKLLRKYDIPAGMFYRDAYWRHPSFSALSPGLKGRVLQFLFKLEFMLYERYLHCLFLPDVSMKKLLNPRDKLKVKSLPPGIKFRKKMKRPGDSGLRKLLYIGGIQKPLYDITPLLNFISKRPDLELTLCCRKKEYEICEKAYEFSKNVSVVHKSGEELNELYDCHDVFIIFRNYNDYHDITVPVKIYETVAQGLPLLVFGESLDAFTTEENSFGFTFSNDMELSRLLECGFDEDFHNSFNKSVRENSWYSRVRLIENELLG